MLKTCKNCKTAKNLGEFFTAPDIRQGTSEFCKECHDSGLIKHGYGWYGDKWKSPTGDHNGKNG